MPSPLTIIAAVASNGVIGIANRLPWRLPEDLRRFKALTTGQAVIMGRKTWESLPPGFRPLPDRCNIVVTRDPAYRADGAVVVHSLAQAVAAADAALPCVIGGADLYRQALPLAARLELTELDAAFDGDTYFPEYDRAIWREVSRERHRSADGLAFSFVSYARK